MQEVEQRREQLPGAFRKAICASIGSARTIQTLKGRINKKIWLRKVKPMWIQEEIVLSAKPRGFHLITDEVLRKLPVIRTVECGLLHLFIKHTSASLTINENADPTVRLDLESHFNKAVPERAPYYKHDYEGDDDMPAHIKSSLLGASMIIPITQGALNLGTWQGIYLCEHRNHGGTRRIVATIQGEAFNIG